MKKRLKSYLSRLFRLRPAAVSDNQPASAQPRVFFVDIGKPLAEVVKKNNQKEIISHWESSKSQDFIEK